MATHELSTEEEHLSAGRFTMALDASEAGGLVAFGSGPHTLTVVPIDAHGQRSGEARALPVRRLATEVALERAGEHFLLMATGRCEGGSRVCFFGFLLDARGDTIGEPARTFHGPYGARPLPLESRATGRIWMVGIDSSPSFYSEYWGESLAEVDGEPVFEEMERCGVPWEARDEVRFVRSFLGSAVDDRLHLLFGFETRGLGDSRVGRGFDDALVSGFRGAVRDFVVYEGKGHVLIEEPSGDFFTARLPRVDSRTPVTAGGPLPAPFADRVLVALSDDGELRLRDARGRRVGTAVPLGPHAEAVAFTGERFLVALSGAPPRIASVECASHDARP